MNELIVNKDTKSILVESLRPMSEVNKRGAVVLLAVVCKRLDGGPSEPQLFSAHFDTVLKNWVVDGQELYGKESNLLLGWIPLPKLKLVIFKRGSSYDDS